MNDIEKKVEELEKRIDKLKLETIEKPIEKKSGITGEKVLAEMIAGLLFGFICGWYIDEYFDTKPLFLLIMIFLGLAGSIYNIYKETEK
ncbi:MAG TPA: hypothetical protein DIV86_02110 [Alphaproteobacteria bacterium]|nr:hypothetical protein [Alphaproteobacteria bacterium]